MRTAALIVLLLVIACGDEKTEPGPITQASTPGKSEPPAETPPAETPPAGPAKDDLARLCRIAADVTAEAQVPDDQRGLETMKRMADAKPSEEMIARLSEMARLQPTAKQEHLRTMIADFGAKELDCKALLDIFTPRPTETTTAVIEAPPPPEPVDPREMLTSTEALGDLRLGLTLDELKKLLPGGKTKGKREEEGATGEFVQSFVDSKQGVDVLLTATSATGPQSVRAITIRAPSTRTTKRGIGIGSKAEDVMKAYADVLDTDFPPTPESIIAGSIYDGVIFTVESDEVTSIFIGPGAE